MHLNQRMVHASHAELVSAVRYFLKMCDEYSVSVSQSQMMMKRITAHLESLIWRGKELEECKLRARPNTATRERRHPIVIVGKPPTKTATYRKM